MRRIVVFALALLALAGFSFSVNVSTCQDLSAPGAYELNTSLSGANVSGPSCILISSSDVLFDCMGYSIANNGTAGTTYGVIAWGAYTNITVRNCPNITQYYYGIYLRNVVGGWVSNVTAHDNYIGIDFWNTSQSTILDSLAFNGTYGINVATGSNDNVLVNNTVNDTMFGLSVAQNALRNNYTNNTAFSNQYGFYASTSYNGTYLNNSAFRNQYGFYFTGSSDYHTFLNNTAYNNSATGFLVNGSEDFNTYFFNRAYDNLNSGFAAGGDHNLYVENVAWNNGWRGFDLNGAEYNNLTNNTAYNNTNGFYLIAISNNNTLDRNIAFNNTNAGFFIQSSADNNLTNNNASGDYYGFYLYLTADYSELVGNIADGTTMGFYLRNTNRNYLAYNTAHNVSGTGFSLTEGSNSNIFVGDTANGTIGTGFSLTTSPDNNFTNITSCDTVGSGLDVEDSNNTLVVDAHIYDNAWAGLYHRTNGFAATSFFVNITFDNPIGNMQNFTTLYINDTIEPNTRYIINWSANPGGLPLPVTPLADKFTRIFTQLGTASIDTIMWTWTDLESATFDESLLQIWKNNGSWADTGAVLDTAANTLTLTNMNPQSYYGIVENNMTECMEINSSGTYQLLNNVTGAPINASDMGYVDWACIKIASSDVMFDCNGYNITNNGTAFAAAIAVNGTSSAAYANVTVQNCPGLSGNYYYSFIALGISNSTIRNNTAYGAEVYDFNIEDSEFVIFDNNTAYGSQYHEMFVQYTNHSVFTNNVFHDAWAHGMVEYYSMNNTYTGNTAYNNPSFGFLFFYDANNTYINNTAYNNDEGFTMYPSFNATMVNNTAHGNNYGFDLYGASNGTLNNNTAYNNTYGFYLDQSAQNNTIMYATATGNGYGFYIVGASDNNTLVDSSINGNSQYGLYLQNSNATKAANLHLFNNSMDVYLRTDATPRSLAFTNLTIDNPLGNTENYTSLAIADTLNANSGYSIRWTSNSSALPAFRSSFAQKFVNVSTVTGTPSIDYMSWSWLDVELSSYDESMFGLWKYNPSGWALMNGSPDTLSNTLSLFAFNPASDYGILQFNSSVTQCAIINTSGDYQLANNLVGAPISAAPRTGGGFACIKITSNDVVLDCNGFNITNNGTLNSRAILPIGVRNVTVKNCPRIAEYYGPAVDIFNTTNGTFSNITSFNNSYGFFLFENVSYITVEGSTVSYSWNPGFYVNGGSRGCHNVSIDNNTIHGTGTQEAVYLSLAHDNNVTNNVVYNTTESAIFVYGSNNSNIWGNTVYDSGEYGIYLYQTPDADLRDNHIYDSGFADLYVRSLGTPFGLSATNITIDNPLGTMQNYTSLDITDTVEGGASYSVAWEVQPAAPPAGYAAFEQKFIDISELSGAVSIDTVVWHWTDAEAAAYAEDFLRAVHYGTAYSEVENQVLAVGANTITVTALDDFSPFGILQFNDTNVSVLKINQTTDAPSPGGMAQFNITVNNTGNVTLNPVVVVDALESGLTYYLADPLPDAVAGQTLTWNNVGPLAPGAITVIYVNATVDAGAVNASAQSRNLTNYVNVSGTPPLGSAVVSEDYENVTAYHANVSLLKVDITPLPPSPGGLVQYSINVSNPGLVSLVSVHLEDTLPAGLTFDAAFPPEDSVLGQTVVWDDLGTILPGGAVMVYMNATVDNSTVNGTYTNTATAEGQPPNGFNVTASGFADIGVNSAAMGITKTASNTHPTVGQTLSYSVNITNTGQVNLSELSMSDTLPSNMAYVAASPPPTTVVGQALTWDAFANLTPGQSVLVTYNVTTNATGQAVNNVTAFAAPPNGNNATGNASMTINVATPPSGGGEDEPDYGSVEWERDCPGNGLTVTVRNGGPISGAGVKLYMYSPRFELVDEGTTDDDGEVEFTMPEDGIYRLYADAGSYEFEDGYEFEYAMCVECYSDAGCTDTERCAAGGCEEVTGECGYAASHAWVEYGCCADDECGEGYRCFEHNCELLPEPERCEGDSDCADGEYCSSGDCLPVMEGACGYVEAHAWHDYECCADGDCDGGYVCEGHSCREVEAFSIDTEGSGYVGEEHAIKVFRDGGPFSNGTVRIITPDGSEFMRIADSEGRVVLPLEAEGGYEIQLLFEGAVVDQASVDSRQKPVVEEEGWLPALLQQLIRAIPFIILLVGAALLFFLLYKRRKKKRFVPTARRG